MLLQKLVHSAPELVLRDGRELFRMIRVVVPVRSLISWFDGARGDQVSQLVSDCRVIGNRVACVVLSLRRHLGQRRQAPERNEVPS